MHRLPTRLLSLGMAAFLLSVGGCATGKNARVIQRESGRLEAIGTGEKESEATLAALDKAQHFCKERDKAAVFPDNVDVEGKDSDEVAELFRKIPGIQKVIGEDDVQVALAFNCR